jgi:hypothetical protein
MIKKLMLSLCAVASSLGFAAQAQQGRSCGTDDFYRDLKAQHPEIRFQENLLKADVERYVRGKIAPNPMAKTAFDANDALVPWPADTTQYHIPVVFHIVYSDNGEALQITDNDIYGAVERLNRYYNGQDPRITGIINTWKPYIGKPNITFHLATKDPTGKPTHGILRHYSYASDRGDESAKLEQWPPDQYLNIWLINVIGRGTTKGIVLAYATFPTSYSTNPYSQGVISRADQALQFSSIGDEYTLAHEIGHYLYLSHPWANNGKEVEDTTACGDDDVDDTPPTYGHQNCGFAALYDKRCATGYLKDYDSATYYHMTGLSIPNIAVANRDTTNVSVTFSPATSMALGQTFTIGGRNVDLLNIALLADSGNTGTDTLRLKLYDATGTSLVATSNGVRFSAFAQLLFDFTNVRLNANTTYKMVVSTSGTRGFALRANTNNPYLGGMMYSGPAASIPVAGTDLYFVVNQLHRIDYPDTTNTQNIMDYSGCPSEMFTKGQVARMRGALRSDVGYRSSIIDTANLVRTGVMNSDGTFAARPDLPPTALFTVNRPFICADGSATATFTNRSYNDTISSANWTFDRGGGTSTSTGIAGAKFNEAGWVTATLEVTDNDGQTGSLTRSDLVYAADPNGVQPFIEDFNPGSPMLDRFPIFNYFGNPTYNWQLTNTAGFYDNTSIKFNNYDPRNANDVLSGVAVNTATQSPRGLYADFYTPAYDLGGFGANNCYLTFHSAGAFRTSKLREQADTLIVSYSTNCGGTWTELTRLDSRSGLGNNGVVTDYFVPAWMGNWQQNVFNIPPIARSSNTYFRFRFLPGTDNAYIRYSGLDFGTGNNFYIDRVGVTEYGLGVKNGVIAELGMSVLPNPTNGAATIQFNGGDNSQADVTVTDVTGKVVYRTSVVRSQMVTKVQIPASALTVKGMYLVQVVTNGATETKKLVAY